MFSLLAFDAGTSELSVGVQSADGSMFLHQGAGGALASQQLIGVCRQLLSQAKLSLSELDAIAVGVGPGAFTGLRAACAVGQGFAFAAGVPLLGLSSLDILLEQGQPLLQQNTQQNSVPPALHAVLDARMGQVYSAVYASRRSVLFYPGSDGALLSAQHDIVLTDYADWQPGKAALAVGNVRQPLAQAGLPLPPLLGYMEATPQAQAMLALATRLLQSERPPLLQPAGLVPVYVRNKVAQTTAERLSAKRQAL